MLLALIPLFGGFVNTFFRGGLYRYWFDVKLPGKIINAVLYGLTAYLVSRNAIFAPLMALGMYIGQGPSLFNEATDRALAHRDGLKWSMIVFVRGLFWALCIGIPIAIYYPTVFPMVLPAFFCMPCAYGFQWWFKGNYGPRLSIHAWSLSEFTYGILLWLPLAAII